MVNNNAEILKEVINGNAAQEYAFNGLKQPFKLKPLTSMQIVELQGIEKKGQKGTIHIKQDVIDKHKRGKTKALKNEVNKQMQNLESEIDYSSLKRNIANTKYRAISLSAEIPEAIVWDLPAELVDDIFAKVVEISSLTKKDLDLLADFRQE
jgi:hypothetical protein